MNQVYIVLRECVEHFIDDDGKFTDRNKVKRIATRCGDIVSQAEFEDLANNGHIDLNDTVILID
jgi:hypothetical protein